MSFNHDGTISTLNGKPLKLVDHFTYLGSNISTNESDVNIRTAKSRTIIDRLLIKWKSDLSDKIKWEFFQAVAVSLLLYGCITWTWTKLLEKKPETTKRCGVLF